MNRKEQIDKATPSYRREKYSHLDHCFVEIDNDKEGKQQAFKEGAEWADNNPYYPHWYKTSEKELPFGEEVIAFNEKWIDEDFNPNGTRIGFLQDDGFISATWNDEQDCYDTCYEEGDDYYKGNSGIPGADEYNKQFAKPNMPTHWMRIPTHP